MQEEDHDESFTIAQTYPKLADLFDDDPNEEYPLPFDNPDDLMMIFSDLEEKNLSLIQQAQDQDQILEKTRKEFAKIRFDIEGEIKKLKDSEMEVKGRTAITLEQKQSLENQTSEGNNKILPEASYDKIRRSVMSIKQMVDRNKSQDQDPLTMLLEIERVVDKYIKMYETAALADVQCVQKHSTFIRMQIRNEKTKKRIELEQFQLVEERARKLQERMNRKIVTGTKPKVPRSEKPPTKKKEEKKQDLTDEQLDLKKYLGDLTHAEDKKQ